MRGYLKILGNDGLRKVGDGDLDTSRKTGSRNCSAEDRRLDLTAKVRKTLSVLLFLLLLAQQQQNVQSWRRENGRGR